MTRPVVVVGAGVFGSALALELVTRGHEVVLVEKESPGHSRATSSGDTRLIRLAHGADEWGVESARRSLDAWRRLEQATGASLLVPTGLVWFAREDEGWEKTSADVLDRLGVHNDRLPPERLLDWFPSIELSGIAWVLHEHEASVIRARATIHALVSAFQSRGGRLVRGHASYTMDGVLVDGAEHSASRVVWVCGPWLKQLFPALAPLRITRQDEFYVAAPPGEDWRATTLPGWLDFDRGTYGVGDLDGLGIKCGVDVMGPEVDPETFDRMPDPQVLAKARQLLASRFPSLMDAPLVGSRVCQYEFTADSNFLLGPVPETDGRQWLMGGGSGQGFKHAPYFAETAADAMTLEIPVDPRFALGVHGAPGGTARTAATRDELIPWGETSGA